MQLGLKQMVGYTGEIYIIVEAQVGWNMPM